MLRDVLRFDGYRTVEAATGEPFVQHWMHTALISMNGEKMSKSLGNFFTIRELVDYETELKQLVEQFPAHVKPVTHGDSGTRSQSLSLPHSAVQRPLLPVG